MARLNARQAAALQDAIALANEYMPDDVLPDPSWIDVDNLETPDLTQWITARFPGRYVPDAEQQDDHEPEPWWEGVYIALIDREGAIRTMNHSTGGRLETTLAGVVRQRGAV